MNLSRAISIASRWMQGHVVTLRDGEAREYHKLCHEALKRMREQESAKNAHYNCCKKTNSSWISVADRLPDDMGDVLVVAFWHERWQTMIGWCRKAEEEWRVYTSHGEMIPGGVTHWIPLPTLPEVDAT